MSQQWKPHDYQLAGVRFVLENSHCGLWLSPGLGKSSMMLAAFMVLKAKGMVQRMLVIAPPKVATLVWPAEKEKWIDFHGLSMVVLHGPKKDKLACDHVNMDTDIFVVTPDGYRSFVSRGWDLKADMLVVDESSQFRDHTTQRFKAIRGKLPLYKRRITLTGTPAPNGYLNLWSQAFIMDMGGALEPYVTHYRNKYFTDVARSNTYSEWVLNPGAAPVIDARLKPLVLREDAVDHLQMPSLIENIIPVNLPIAARHKYERMEDDYYVLLDDGSEAAALQAAAAQIKLRQIANGFVYDTSGKASPLHTEKINALQALLDDLNGQPALIFYEFVEDKRRISTLLKGVPSLSDVSTAQAKQLVDDFNAGKLQYLLAHPASAGWGLNLQGRAQHVIWYGPTWNLEHKLQATARVWRQGNPHDRVFVHTIVVNDSVEQRVAQVLARKDATQAALLAAMKRPRPVKERADAACMAATA